MSHDKELLSRTGRGFLAGLVSHARAAAAFTTPTINGYKRYRSYSLAPDRAIWGRDNRGVMIRVLGGPGDPATRLENRVGEPAANPYLYMASQIVTGLDGMERMLDPGPSADTPYEAQAPLLPKTLEEALGALRDRRLPRRRLRQEFHRLLSAHQGGRDRALQCRGHGMGAARIFRAVLGAPAAGWVERSEMRRPKLHMGIAREKVGGRERDFSRSATLDGQPTGGLRRAVQQTLGSREFGRALAAKMRCAAPL